MKTFTLRKSSWHYRLAQYYWPSDRGQRHWYDICSYIRSVVRGLIVVAMLMMVSCFMLYPLADLIIWSLAGWPGSLNTRMYFYVVGAILLIFALATVVMLGIEHHWWIKSKPKMEREPGFIRLAYRSVHDHICLKINFK